MPWRRIEDTEILQGNEKVEVMGIEREDNLILTHPRTGHHSIVVIVELFEHYIGNDCETIKDCYLVERGNNWTEVKNLGTVCSNEVKTVS